MNEEKVIAILKQACHVLQSNYRNVDKCKEDITALLNDIDELHIEMTGQKIVKRTTVIEKLTTGLYGQ